MRNLRIGLTVATGCLVLLAQAASAVVVQSQSGHRLSVRLRQGVSLSGLHGLRPVTAATTGHGLLVNHGGQVLHSETPYLIFWEPAGHSIAASSKTVMTQYMSDVAADSGASNNVYSVLAQYTDSAGAARYQQTFGSAQAIDDLQSYPSNNGGCPLATGLTACVTDPQLQAEVARVIAANHLPTGTGTGAPVYLVITPQDVNVCLSGGSCASSNFCAYHGAFATGGSSVVYASVPFAVWAGGSTKGCQDDGTSLYQTPNQGTQSAFFGDHGYQIADNLSHELSESITDPLLNAWYTKSGAEVGDLCEAFASVSNPSKDVSAHAYFPILAGTASGANLVDQYFVGHYYYNQTEWSNRAGDCVATS